jgi:hypothetical protein
MTQVVKLLQSGGVEWEQGDNRSISLPALSTLLATCGAVKVNCPYGDASSTLVQLVGDKAMLQVGLQSLLLSARDRPLRHLPAA